jgi:hypothetical protein
VIGTIQYAKTKISCISETYVETYGCISGRKCHDPERLQTHLLYCDTAHIRKNLFEMIHVSASVLLV